MEKRSVLVGKMEEFEAFLRAEEKSEATVGKYIRDIKAFILFAGDKRINKETIIEYKGQLKKNGYQVSSINSMLSSINCFLNFLGRQDLKVKTIKTQRRVFCERGKELTRSEYIRLVKTAFLTGNERLGLILQTLCGTGIRISELRFITVEAAKKSEAAVSCKGKERPVIIVKSLRKKLLKYASNNKITSGSIFITRSGRPLDRTNIWREMKRLCEKAKVDPKKVFPHNLRHLFARVFYELKKDIVKLADVLGHSSINTTRIYIISTGEEHRKYLEEMHLII